MKTLNSPTHLAASTCSSNCAMSVSYEVTGAMVIQWIGEQAALYTARAMGTMVVRHGILAVSFTEFVELKAQLAKLGQETGIETVIYDMRAAPTRCECPLCEVHNSQHSAVLVARQPAGTTTLEPEIKRFSSFNSAMAFVRPNQLVPTCVPCPLGIERVISEIAERRGAQVFGNYAGAVFELPKQQAVYVHLSGHPHEGHALLDVLGAMHATANLIKATHAIVDRRQGEYFKFPVLSHSLLSRCITTLVIVGAGAGEDLPEQYGLSKKTERCEAPTLRSVLVDVRLNDQPQRRTSKAA